MLVSYSFSVMRLCLVSKGQKGKKKETSYSNKEGRFFVSKRGFPCIEETPSSYQRNTFFVLKGAFL